MEKKKDKLYKAIARRSKPIFDKVLKETNKNHVSVGLGRIEEDYSYSFYNPHNARYYFNFDRKNISKKPVSRVGSFHKDLKVINSTELCNSDFLGCRVVVKKSKIEITNKINKERLFSIDGSEDNRKNLVQESVSILLHECIDILYKFIKVYGGNSDYVCVNYHVADNKILHDKIVDTIPSKTTFRNEIVKKVYKTEPKNIEMSDPVFASNHFRNSGLYDYSPMIAKELNNLNNLIKIEIQPLKFLENNIFVLDDIFNYSSIIEKLSSVQKLEFEDLLMKKFGVGFNV